jgi:hypothetical protein
MGQPDPRDFSRSRLAHRQGEQSRQAEYPHVPRLDSGVQVPGNNSTPSHFRRRTTTGATGIAAKIGKTTANG